MKKVGRNEPCPCGSGKKFKKCHGASNVVQLHPGIYDRELDQLQSDLLVFATDRYEDEIAESTADFPLPDFAGDEEAFQAYMTSITAWASIHAQINDEETIFDRFYSEKQHHVNREQVKKAFDSWRFAPPSVYEIIDVRDESVIVSDLRRGDQFEVISVEENDFERGLILVGILVPYVQRQAFLMNALVFYELDDELADQIEDMSDAAFVNIYPGFLQKLLLPEPAPAEITWDNPLYEMVAVKLQNNMGEKEAAQELIDTAILIWKIFTEKEKPFFRKLGSYAAAVEYVLQRDVMAEWTQSQEELADEYEISVTTLSKNANKIAGALAAELEEFSLNLNEQLPDIDEALPVPGLLTMEKTMRDFEKAIENQEFETEEEMHAFLDSYINNQLAIDTGPESPRDIAQDLLYESTYEGDRATRKAMIQEALEIYPHSADAYLLMTEYAKTKQEKFQLLQQGVGAGEKDLGKEFIKENEGHFWLQPETRPYMRAKAALADFQYKEGNRAEAMQVYEELLKLNPGDNQGVRYALMRAYMEEKNYKSARNLADQYDDAAASFQFNRALLQYREEGLTEETLNLLEAADDDNPFVRQYILGDTPVPAESYDFSGLGNETEAIIYAQKNMHLWEDTDPLKEAWRKL